MRKNWYILILLRVFYDQRIGVLVGLRANESAFEVMLRVRF